jgi:hypothetical protein
VFGSENSSIEGVAGSGERHKESAPGHGDTETRRHGEMTIVRIGVSAYLGKSFNVHKTWRLSRRFHMRGSREEVTGGVYDDIR